MATVERFEDLIAWQKARLLAKGVYLLTQQKQFEKDWSLARQIQRVAVSVMANTAKGFDRHNPAEFHQFLSMARASCAEVHSHIYIAFDVGYITEPQFRKVIAASEELSRVLAGLQAYIKTVRPKRPPPRSATPNSELRTPNSKPNPNAKARP